jgi:hypothetical protein
MAGSKRKKEVKQKAVPKGNVSFRVEILNDIIQKILRGHL